MIEEEEELELIGNRKKGFGDTWVTLDGREMPSLTDTLEDWFQTNKRNVQFRLDPLGGKLYVINLIKREIEEPVQKTYNMYGEDI